MFSVMAQPMRSEIIALASSASGIRCPDRRRSLSLADSRRTGSLSADPTAGASTYFLDINGVAYGTGSNFAACLGNGSNTASFSSPVAVASLSAFVQLIASGTTGTSVYGVTVDGDLMSFGYNANGNLGVGDQVNRSSPVAVLGGHRLNILPRVTTTTLSNGTPGTNYTLAMGDTFVKLGLWPWALTEPTR